VRRRADEAAALDVQEEAAANATVGAGAGHPVLRDPPKGHIGLHQGAGRTDDRASATIDARRLGQLAIELYADRGVRAAPRQVDRSRADDLVADPGTARAKDAVVRIDLEIGRAHV